MTDRRGLFVAIAMALTLLSTGCSVVGPEADPHPITADDVPYDLLVDDRVDTTTTVSDGSTVTIYLVRDGELVPVDRSLPPDGALSDLLALLAVGADEGERLAGFVSPTPETGAFRGVEVVRGVAEVELGPGFEDLTGEAQVLAIGQVVLTVTGRPGIGRVGFSFDGGPVEAPRGDGSVTSDPLARDDFADLVPPG